MRDDYPTTKEIIYLLGMGTLLVGSILMPGLGYTTAAIDRAKRRSDWEKSQRQWRKFNARLLWYNLKRLRQQKVVEIIEENGQPVVKLTRKGRTKYLKFKLEQLSLSQNHWDGKWRMVIYDITRTKKNQQGAFRNILKYINFLKLQKSVYITPYPCEEQIVYLREYFGIGDEVMLIRADKIENENIYKEYFGL